MGHFDATDVAIVKRNPWLMRLAIAPLAAGASLVAMAPVGERAMEGVWWAGVALASLGAATSVIAWLLDAGKVEDSARLSADAEGVYLDGRTIVSRWRVRAGYVQPPAQGQPTVRLLDDAQDVLLEVSVRDCDQGRALLSALDLDACQAPLSVDALSPFRSLVPAVTLVVAMSWACLGFASWLRGTHDGLGGVFLVGILAALAMVPTRVTVGADGIQVRWLWRDRFIPFSDVRGIVKLPNGLAIRCAGGGDETVATTSPGESRVDDGARDALAFRIESALAAYAGNRPDAHAASALRRATSTTGEWLGRARALGVQAADGVTTYRTAAIPLDRLWAVYADPAADASARVGAVLALRGCGHDPVHVHVHGHEASQARLAAVAEATVSPSVRFALEAVIHGRDDAEIAAALDGCDLDEGGKRGRHGA